MAGAQKKKKLDDKDKLKMKTMTAALRNAIKAGQPCGVWIGEGVKLP